MPKNLFPLDNTKKFTDQKCVGTQPLASGHPADRERAAGRRVPRGLP